MGHSLTDKKEILMVINENNCEVPITGLQDDSPGPLGLITSCKSAQLPGISGDTGWPMS